MNIYIGTRGAVDFSEVPSHLFEHFSRDPYLIHSWAKHKTSGHQPPLDLVIEALRTRDAFPALDIQKQVGIYR